MLRIEGIDAGYGAALILRGVSLEVAPGEVHCLAGRNGAGKTTLMKAVMGLLPLRAGRILLGDEVVSDLPAYEVPRRGIGYVPQGRRLFGELTVAQNLQIGLRARHSPKAAREGALARFPRLADRLGQRADTLSGGEQQMLAIARALCLQPSVLLLDEPTEGLQPTMIGTIRDVVAALRAEGVAVLLVEQRIEAVLAIADRVTVLENGQVRETLPAGALRTDPARLASLLAV